MGAVWARSWPDGTAEVVPPRISHAESEETAQLLLRELDGCLSSDQVRAAFAYVSSDDSRSLRLLSREGFRSAGEMLVMARTTECDSKATTGESPSFRRYHPSQQQHLMELVRQTYVGSLDFPTLGGIRHVGDVLARYAGTGDSGADHWWFVHAGGRDVGCLLLADHQRTDQCELAYMGLVPDARGNGWGRRVVARALETAQDIGRQQIILGVDAHNDPAIAVYASAGFIEQCRRLVLSKMFR